MSLTVLIAITAIGVSVLTYVSSQVWAARSATLEHVRSLQERIDRLEKDVADCQRRWSDLYHENIYLMRRLTEVTP